MAVHGAPAAAATGVQVALSRPLTVYPFGVNQISVHDAALPVELSSTTAFGDSYGYSDFGVVRASATIKGKIKVPAANLPVGTPLPYQTDLNSAFSFWRDDLSISGGVGSGVVDVSLFIDGKISSNFPTTEGRSSVFASVSMQINNGNSPGWGFSTEQNRYTNKDGSTFQTSRTTIATPAGTSYDYSFPTGITWAGKQTFSIPFIFGRPFEVRVNANCSTGGGTGVFNGGNPVVALSGASVGASCDLGNSVYWGGISAVRSSTGALLTSYGLTSGSGFDYRNASPELPAVPEPAIWAMLIGGFAMTGMAMRRRNTSEARAA